MTSLGRQGSTARRAACIGLLAAVALLPVTACGDTGGGGSGDSEVEDVDTDEQQDDDGGLY